MNKKIILLGRVSIIISLSFLTACGFFGDTVEDSPGAAPATVQTRRKLTTIRQQPLEREKNRLDSGDEQTRDVEILWQIPSIAVDGFVIEYRTDRQLQPTKVKVTAAELQKLEDAQLGYVYRYVLPKVPEKSLVTVRLASYIGETVSATSEPFVVEPGQQVGGLRQ